MPEAVDYRAAALAAVEAQESAEPKTEEPVAESKEAAPADPAADNSAEKTDSDKPEVPVKAAEKAEDAPKSRFEKSFEDLVREKAELRKAREELKAQGSTLARDQKLMEAVKSGDAMAILAAAGVKWDPSKPVPQPQVNPMANLAQEVASLKAELAETKRQKVRGGVLDQAKAMSAKEEAKYPYVKALGEEESALGYIEKYFAENNELPVPGDWNESIALAMEATENRLRKEAERFKKVSAPLTDPKAGAKKDEKQAVPSAVSKDSKTLTNSSGAGPKSVSVYQPNATKSSDDYRKAALSLFESEG